MSWILTMMIVGQVVDLMWKNRADFELDWFWAQSRAIVCISDLRLTSIWIESEYEFERDKCAVPWRSVKIKMYAAIMLTWMFRFSPAAIIYLNRRGKCFISTIQLWKWNNHSTLYQEFNQSDRHQSRRISYFIYFSPCSLSLSLSLFPSFPPFLPPPSVSSLNGKAETNSNRGIRFNSIQNWWQQLNLLFICDAIGNNHFPALTAVIHQNPNGATYFSPFLFLRIHQTWNQSRSHLRLENRFHSITDISYFCCGRPTRQFEWFHSIFHHLRFYCFILFLNLEINFNR